MGLHLVGGNRRPRKSTTGVASAHGSQAMNSLTNKRNQAWCIPSARITNTFCVASNSPTADQINAIQNHCDDLRTASIIRMLCYYAPPPADNAANPQRRAAKSLAF